MYIKRKIKFILHKRKAGVVHNLNIRMRVTLSGQRPIDFPLGHKIDEKDWDAEAECVKAGAVNSESQTARDINRIIAEYKAFINEVFARYELLEKRIPTAQEVKELFNDLSGRSNIIVEAEQNNDLFYVFKLFTRQMGQKNNWTVATHTKFKTLYRHLEAYDPNLQLNKLSEDTLQGFVSYYYSKGFRNTTIAKQISFVRWFLRWAANNRYYNGNLHDSFKPKLKGTAGHKEIIYLTKEEIKQLQNYEFKPTQRYLERVRDVFLFQCFTGLRYSDVEKLRPSDIQGDVIHFVTKKTVDELRVELNKHSKSIIDKYKMTTFADERVLPVISNAKMNEYLKKVGQMAGLDNPTRIVYFKGENRYEEVYPKWQLLTTHCGRRTFVVTALLLGIPIEVIMRWTGHSSYESMKPYVKIVDELKARSMSKFDEL